MCVGTASLEIMELGGFRVKESAEGEIVSDNKNLHRELRLSLRLRNFDISRSQQTTAVTMVSDIRRFSRLTFSWEA